MVKGYSLLSTKGKKYIAMKVVKMSSNYRLLDSPYKKIRWKFKG